MELRDARAGKTISCKSLCYRLSITKMMEVVSVKVDSDTKQRMRRLSRVNWSETIRRAIEKTIEEEELRERNVKPRDVRKARLMADSIRRPSKGWDSTREIRKWRDRRR